MAARQSFQAPAGMTEEQRDCVRDSRCEGKTRDAEGIWHPAKTWQPFCQPCTARIVSCAADLPALYAVLAARLGDPIRRPWGRRTAPGPRIPISGEYDALLRLIAAQTAGWAARVRAVPGLSLSPSRHGHGKPERVQDDCRVFTLHPAPLLALADGPTARVYPWPLTAEEEERLGGCEILRLGDDWVRVLEPLDGTTAGLEILDLHARARRLSGQTPAPADLLDGIPCRACEAMSSLEVLPAVQPDPEKPEPAFCECSVPGCRDRMTRTEYDGWVRQYGAWTRGAGVLTCRRCELGWCGECVFLACQCRASGHRKASWPAARQLAGTAAAL